MRRGIKYLNRAGLASIWTVRSCLVAKRLREGWRRMTIHLAGNLYTPSAVRFIRIIPKPIGLALRPVSGLPRPARRFPVLAHWATLFRPSDLGHYGRAIVGKFYAQIAHAGEACLIARASDKVDRKS